MADSTPVETWKTKIIMEKWEQIKKEEIRAFMIAYGELPEELHGYLSEFPNNVQVWYSGLEDVEVDYLKSKDCPIWLSGNKVYIKTYVPFLGVNGCLAQAQLDGTSITQQFQPVSIAGKDYIKATINTSKGVSTEAFAVLEKDNPQIDAVELATSNSLRKALSNLGYGRFPLECTKFGDHPLIKEFREFKKNKNVNS